MELLSFVSNVKSSSTAVTFEAPCMSDGVSNSSPLQVTPLRIQSRKQGEPVAICNETHDLPPSEIDPLRSPTEPSNQEHVYWGQSFKDHSGRSLPLIRSLSKGLKGDPLTEITKMLPMDHT